MASKKINYKKAILSTIIWTIIYFAFIIYYIKQDLGINLLSSEEVRVKYIGFVSGQWSMDTRSSLLFLGTVILFIPVWIIGSMILYHINWKRPHFFKRKDKSFKRELISSKQIPHTAKMPVKLRFQSYGKSSFNSLQTQDNNTPAEATHAVLSSNDKDNDLAKIQEQIKQLIETYQGDVFSNIILDGFQIPLAIATEDETAYLISIISDPEGHLVVDASNTPQECLNADWFGTRGPITAPAKYVFDAAQKLTELENGSKVVPVMVIANGEVDDAENVMNMLHQNNVILVRFEQGGPDILEPLEAFLDSRLKRKQDEQ